MLASNTGCLLLERMSIRLSLVLLVLSDIEVEHLVVRTTFSVPACVVVTVFVISPGGTRLPTVGETGGDIRFSMGGPILFVNDMDSWMADFGIGINEANIELGIFSFPLSDNCISILFTPVLTLLFLCASSFSSGLDGGVIGLDGRMECPTNADMFLPLRVVFTATGIEKEF